MTGRELITFRLSVLKRSDNQTPGWLACHTLLEFPNFFEQREPSWDGGVPDLWQLNGFHQGPREGGSRGYIWRVTTQPSPPKG